MQTLTARSRPSKAVEARCCIAAWRTVLHHVVLRCNRTGRQATAIGSGRRRARSRRRATARPMSAPALYNGADADQEGQWLALFPAGQQPVQVEQVASNPATKGITCCCRTQCRPPKFRCSGIAPSPRASESGPCPRAAPSVLRPCFESLGPPQQEAGAVGSIRLGRVRPEPRPGPPGRSSRPWLLATDAVLGCLKLLRSAAVQHPKSRLEANLPA